MRNIGLLVEGGIEEELFPSLLGQALSKIMGRAGAPPLLRFPYPPNGFGEIPKTLRILVKLYEHAEERARIGCDMFVIVHDSRRTEGVQREIRKILSAAPTFPAVYGLAVEETEAWVLGDIDHLNSELFRRVPAPSLPNTPERDPDPKHTLTELYIRRSKRIEYDCWNRACAALVAPLLRSEVIAGRCPRGFGRLRTALEAQARRHSRGNR